jgi:hypothetical protein
LECSRKLLQKPTTQVGDVGHRLGVVGVVALPDPLGLEAQEEALHDCVIPTIPFAAHAANQAVAHQ